MKRALTSNGAGGSLKSSRRSGRRGRKNRVSAEGKQRKPTPPSTLYLVREITASSPYKGHQLRRRIRILRNEANVEFVSGPLSVDQQWWNEAEAAEVACRSRGRGHQMDLQVERRLVQGQECGSELRQRRALWKKSHQATLGQTKRTRSRSVPDLRARGSPTKVRERTHFKVPGRVRPWAKQCGD